jgi:hypothetical protein
MLTLLARKTVSLPPPERERSTAFAPALRRGKCCRVGVRHSALTFDDCRSRGVTPTRLPPTKSGVADLPLSGGGIAERAAPLSPYAIDLERSSVPVTAMTGES